MDATTLARCTGARLDRAQLMAEAISSAMDAYEITTRARQGMFLANIGHETTRLRFLAELGGDDYLSRYNGRLDLGNTQPGDGPRYKGRGLLQTTGRSNYRALTKRLRARGIDCPDFEAEPATLELPQWAALSAADYVGMRNLNGKADAGDFLGYCVGINGKNKATGLPNGWSSARTCGSTLRGPWHDLALHLGRREGRLAGGHRRAARRGHVRPGAREQRPGRRRPRPHGVGQLPRDTGGGRPPGRAFASRNRTTMDPSGRRSGE